MGSCGVPEHAAQGGGSGGGRWAAPTRLGDGPAGRPRLRRRHVDCSERRAGPGWRLSKQCGWKCSYARLHRFRRPHGASGAICSERRARNISGWLVL